MTSSSDSKGSVHARARLTLLVIHPDKPAEEVFVQHGLTLGAAASNAIHVNGDGVASIHARIWRQADGEFVVRAESDASLLLRDESSDPVGEISLEPGCRFRVGSARFRCRAQPVTGARLVSVGNPSQVRCPHCHCSIDPADRPTRRRCSDCGQQIQYFVATIGLGNSSRFEGWLPRKAGPYRLLGFVAAGGMGLVLRGVHSQTNLEAAIKIPQAPLGNEHDWERRFNREIQTLRTLHHRSLVTFQDAGRDGRLIWLAMEWINGQPLSRLIARAKEAERQWAPDQAAQWLRRVVEGLAYLHGRDIVHRDLKPSNILVTSKHDVKLIDFGLAKVAEGTGTDMSLTRTGIAAGTYDYMAPEVRDGNPATPASDIYALGVIWHEMLTYRLPRHGAPIAIDGKVPADFQVLIRRCLDYSPHVRPTAQQVLSSILSIWNRQYVKLQQQNVIVDTAAATPLIVEPPLRSSSTSAEQAASGTIAPRWEEPFMIGVRAGRLPGLFVGSVLGVLVCLVGTTAALAEGAVSHALLADIPIVLLKMLGIVAVGSCWGLVAGATIGGATGIHVAIAGQRRLSPRARMVLWCAVGGGLLTAAPNTAFLLAAVGLLVGLPFGRPYLGSAIGCLAGWCLGIGLSAFYRAPEIAFTAFMGIGCALGAGVAWINNQCSRNGIRTVGRACITTLIGTLLLAMCVGVVLLLADPPAPEFDEVIFEATYLLILAAIMFATLAYVDEQLFTSPAIDQT